MDEKLKMCDKVKNHFIAYDVIDPKKIAADIVATGVTDQNVITSVKLLCADGYMMIDDEKLGTYRLTPNGRKFIEKGGYSGSERKRRNSNIWKGIQTIIIIITACATVGVSMRQCQISKQTMDIQRQVDTLKTK